MNQPDVLGELSEKATGLRSSTARAALRVLMLGYSAANDTGAGALLLADIADVPTAWAMEGFQNIVVRGWEGGRSWCRPGC